MKYVFFAVIYLSWSFAKANDKGTVLLYDPKLVPGYHEGSGRSVTMPGAEPKAVSTDIFEKTIKEAIQVLENSMRGTCAKEMETNISVTAEGKWAVVGVSITGAVKLLIANPDMLKKCSK